MKSCKWPDRWDCAEYYTVYRRLKPHFDPGFEIAAYFEHLLKCSKRLLRLKHSAKEVHLTTLSWIGGFPRIMKPKLAFYIGLIASSGLKSMRLYGQLGRWRRSLLNTLDA